MTTKGNPRLAYLAERVQRGANAETVLKQWEPVIRDRQDAYYRQLVQNTRASGEVDKHTAMLMVALDDLVHDLTSAARTGKQAARKLDEAMIDEAGGSE